MLSERATKRVVRLSSQLKNASRSAVDGKGVGLEFGCMVISWPSEMLRTDR
jgi:hypothetical protein